MAKSFTEIEKSNIKEKLTVNCEESWSKFGYKKTNIDELCAKSGISKGAFYLFYNSKEELFFDVMITVQMRLTNIIEKSLSNNPTKYDLSDVLKLVYREYVKNSFIIETGTPDFIAFINKLPKEKLEELEAHGDNDLRNQIKKANIKYKIDENKGLSILSVLFSPIANKENMPYNHFEVFDFMLDTLVEEIFE